MAKASMSEEVAEKNSMGPGEEGNKLMARGKGKRGAKRRGRRKGGRK